MATLQKIRNKAGLLISIVIGLALLAFILGDFLDSKRGYGSYSKVNIGKIAGEDIPYEYFQAKYEEALEYARQNSGERSLDEMTQDRLREQIWQQLVQTHVMQGEYDKLGIAVSSQELFDMVQGENIHPQVKRLFSNQETGEANREQIMQVLKSIHQEGNEKGKAQWKRVEEELKAQRMFEKYINLIKNGLFVNSLQAKTEFYNNNHKVNLNYIAQSYTSIADSAVNVTEKDINSYYKKHKNNYKQEPSRDIEYVTFDVKASADDDKAAIDWINNIKNEFETDEEIAQFVNLNSETPFDQNYYKKEGLSAVINDFMFAAKKGDVFGPYYENEAYKLARLENIENLPDSVKARHILIQPKGQSQEAMEKAKNLADSLKNAIKKGENFVNLAKKFSSDKGSAEKGGDLGWFKEGAMVTPFNDACFFGKKGEITVVESQYGYHIIDILDKGPAVKKVRVAILERKVTPSSITVQNIYTKASEFAGLNNTREKFENAVKSENLVKKTSPNLKENNRSVDGLESSREIIRWAYTVEESEVSPVFNLGDRFVVAVLTKIREEGFAPLADVKYDITLALKNEKKADKIADKMKTLLKKGKNLDQIAQAMGTAVKSAENIYFNSYSIPELGAEPKLAATAVSIDKNRISEPIKGNAGVYILTVNNESNIEATDFDLEKTRLSNMLQSRIYYESFEALKENAEITDNRVKFY